MAPYTAAAFLQEAGGRVEASARFERAAGDGPDASRGVWCLSVRLYTGQGPLDLLGAHLPVFPVRDAVKFPRALRALSGGADSLWRFVAENPEAFPFAVWYFSDLGTVGSLRHIRAYGSQTFLWRGPEGVHIVRFHWIPVAGEQCLSRREAARRSALEPACVRRDFHDTLALGRTVDFDLCVQLMTPEEGAALPFDPLDPTKIWDELRFPLLPVGRLMLERKAAPGETVVDFAPTRLPPGFAIAPGRPPLCWTRPVPLGREVPVRPAGPRRGADGFVQAGERYRCLPAREKAALIDNMAASLAVEPTSVRRCVIGYARQADENFGEVLAAQIPAYRIEPA